MKDANGSWLQTLMGVIASVVVTAGGVYTVVIVPQAARIEKLEAGREKDGDQLAKLYTSIQTNDEYKKTVRAEIDWLRADLGRTASYVGRIDDEQKRRASSVASIATVEKRIDRMDARLEDGEKRLAAGYTLNDVIKRLGDDLADLRRRVMVPATSKTD